MFVRSLRGSLTSLLEPRCCWEAAVSQGGVEGLRRRCRRPIAAAAAALPTGGGSAEMEHITDAGCSAPPALRDEALLVAFLGSIPAFCWRWRSTSWAQEDVLVVTAAARCTQMRNWRLRGAWRRTRSPPHGDGDARVGRARVCGQSPSLLSHVAPRWAYEVAAAQVCLWLTEPIALSGLRGPKAAAGLGIHPAEPAWAKKTLSAWRGLAVNWDLSCFSLSGLPVPVRRGITPDALRMVGRGRFLGAGLCESRLRHHGPAG